MTLNHTRFDTFENLQIQEQNHVTDKQIQSKLPNRYLLVFLLFLGFVTMHMLQVNLNITIVQMTSNKTIVGNQTITQTPDFDWNSKTIGIVLSLSSYGQLITSSLSGYFAFKFGSVNVFGFGILAMAILTILTPINLYDNFYWFAFCMICQGIAKILSITNTTDIWSRWLRFEERSKIIALTITGIYVGTTVAFPLCGSLAYRYGWQSVFYVTGTIALIWFLIWIMVVSSSDLEGQSHNSAIQSNQKEEYPWKDLLTSTPIWTLTFVKFVYSWSFVLVAQCFPIFIKDTTNNDIENIGILSAIPNFVAILGIPMGGFFIDWLINNRILTPTNAHKTILCVCLSISACTIVVASFMQNFTVIMISFILYKMFMSFSASIMESIPLYLSTRYSSGISGVSVFGHTIAGIISPTVFGFVVTNHSVTQWQTYFMLSAALNVCCAISTFLFSSSEIQPWDK